MASNFGSNGGMGCYCFGILVVSVVWKIIILGEKHQQKERVVAE